MHTESMAQTRVKLDILAGAHRALLRCGPSTHGNPCVPVVLHCRGKGLAKGREDSCFDIGPICSRNPSPCCNERPRSATVLGPEFLDRRKSEGDSHRFDTQVLKAS